MRKRDLGMEEKKGLENKAVVAEERGQGNSVHAERFFDVGKSPIPARIGLFLPREEMESEGPFTLKGSALRAGKPIGRSPL